MPTHYIVRDVYRRTSASLPWGAHFGSDPESADYITIPTLRVALFISCGREAKGGSSYLMLFTTVTPAGDHARW